MNYQYIRLELQPGIATIWLNRPGKRNAFDNRMIKELTHAISKVNKIDENLVVLLKGNGEAFCSGADLNWMRDAVNLDKVENLAECKNLSTCLYKLYSCNKVTIAVVHGAAYGGGLGLVAACDIAICSDDTKFALSELKMGLVASCISPYVVKKMGESRTKELVFTSRQFDGPQAEKYGLVNRSVPEINLEQLTQEYVSLILKGAPEARDISKRLIHVVSEGKIKPSSIKQTARILANVRVSKEAIERIDNFLNDKK